jgi:hypothetical protein
MENMASKVVGSVIVSLLARGNPTRAEWDVYLALLEKLAKEAGGSLKNYRNIVFSDGGMPDSAQRKASVQIIERYQGKDMPVAIVTRDTIARGVVTAAHWFGLNMQAFAPDDADKAFQFLGVSEQLKARVYREVDPLLQQVSCSAFRGRR